MDDGNFVCFTDEMMQQLMMLIMFASQKVRMIQWTFNVIIFVSQKVIIDLMDIYCGYFCNTKSNNVSMGT